jgi:hypothetical protein
MIPKIICSIAAEKSINNLAVPFGSLRYQKSDLRVLVDTYCNILQILFWVIEPQTQRRIE